MRSLHLTPWHIAALIAGVAAATALVAVALLLGKEAAIALAVLLLICVSVARWIIDF